ncbi:DUF2835 family protein [Alkalimonas collagenimarina]|uniref:DUF2835 family protein n=1 Tax=Alkalimonas collagenimarina TaxID=400390 RepID=A0ABT9GWD7_9GAMM|nr:DUF2835 family protein [Alkalimonas collagenimarina]MDP4535268.1 DUF2835 family protein [Alkalimonas collagenimarina]
MRQYHFVMHLSKDECLQYYQGHFRKLVVTAVSGERIQISAKHFHRFIQRDGIHGFFTLTLDSNGKLVRLVKNS